jgi:hypothetical protein
MLGPRTQAESEFNVLLLLSSLAEVRLHEAPWHVLTTWTATTMDVSDTGSLQDGQPPPEPPNLPSTVAVAPRTPVYHLLQMWRRMLPTCVDCGAGKYSGAGKATAATVCVDCGAETYVNVTGATTCLECSWDPCLFPVTFEIFSCTPETNKCATVCKTT